MIIYWYILKVQYSVLNILFGFCRTAIIAGTAIPLGLFLVWDGVILGTLPDLAGSSTVSDPLEQLRSSNGIVGVSIFQVVIQIQFTRKLKLI